MLQSQRNRRHERRSTRIHDLEQGVQMFGPSITIDNTRENDSPGQLLRDLGADERPEPIRRWTSRGDVNSSELTLYVVELPISISNRTDKMERQGQDPKTSPTSTSKRIKPSTGGPDLEREVNDKKPDAERRQGWAYVPRYEASDTRGRQSTGPLPPELELNKKFTTELLSLPNEEKMNYAKVRTAEVWKTYVKDAEREDKEAMGLWMNNMDNLLVFAGIFSAILTAFLVLSSSNLKPDPLDTISSQLARLTLVVVSPAGVIPNTPPDEIFVPSARAVRVNFLWFISLSLAILAATGAMLANSWCMEYLRQSSSGSPFEQAQRRQRRYNGLRKWRFQEIVELLPGLLYLSITLFMIGVCDYLVDFHIGLAITTTVIFFSGLGFALFAVASSMLMGLQAPNEEKMNYAKIRTADVWETYVKDAEREDKEAIGLWMNNMDNLLVFAGLFSAILTAFLVLSSANLKPDPFDTISSQLARLTVVVASPGAVPGVTLGDPFVPSARAVRVNFLWFISLSFSILAAAGAMLANSWCLEYSRQSSSGSLFEQAQRRQRRYNGLQTWKFQEIVELLPGLLYLSIILFMIGICDYLFDFHIGLAITTMVIFSSGLGFALFTIASSIVYEHCPFRVPLLEAAKHLLQELSLSRQNSARRFGDWRMDESDAPEQRRGGVKQVIHSTGRRVYATLRYVLVPIAASTTRFLSHSVATFKQVTDVAVYALDRIWNGPHLPGKAGMDFIEDPIHPDDQTVVDSIRWILQSCSESDTVSAALLLIPDVLRSPRHHFELFRSGASQELIRRCFELRQSSLSPSKGQEAVGSRQLVGLAQLFHLLMRPLQRWSAEWQTHTRDDILHVGFHFGDSAEPEAVALSVAYFTISRWKYGNRWRPILDRTLEASMPRSATLNWLNVVGMVVNRNELQGDLVRLNRILNQYWNNSAQASHDFEVNYVYVSTLASYLGYVRTAKALTSPSYRACLYYCVEHFASEWVETDDMGVIRAAGFVATIASNVVSVQHSLDNIAQTQLRASFERLEGVMTAPWNNHTSHRLAAIGLAQRHCHHYFEISNVPLLISYALYACSKRLGHPNRWSFTSTEQLEAVLSLLIDLDHLDSDMDDLVAILPRCRYLLAQLMTLLKSRELVSQSMTKSTIRFMSELLRWSDLTDSTTLLESLVVARFPDIMRRLLEAELRTENDVVQESTVHPLSHPSPLATEWKGKR